MTDRFEQALVPPLYEAPVSEWIRFHLVRAGGLTPEEAGMYRDVPQFADMGEIAEAVAAKHSPSFEAARDARYSMGHLRYGILGWGQTRAYIQSAIDRLEAYKTDRNREHLVDACNLIELVWIHPDQEGTYFAAQDLGDEPHAASLRKGLL